MLPLLLLKHGKRAFDRQYLMFYVLAAGWLLGTIVADFNTGTLLDSRLKGAARVIFFTLDFIALAIWINNGTRKLVVFALSIVAVFLYYAWTFRGEFLLQWKFGYASALVITSLFCSSYYYKRRRYWVCVGIALVLVLLNLKYAFRSQMGIILISTALILPLFTGASKTGNHKNSNLQSFVRIFVLLTVTASSAWVANKAIELASKQGWFDEATTEKFQTQSNGKLGVLFGGRPETLVAIQAIIDNPIIGHGSFPLEPKYLELKQKIQYDYGYSESDEPEDVIPVIPTHSHLTMAWVESGILGGALWIYILVQVIRAILRISVLRPALAPLYSYMLANFVWDILYSPFGSINRMWAAYLLLLSFSVLRAKEPAPPQAAGHGRTTVSLRREIGRPRFAS